MDDSFTELQDLKVEVLLLLEDLFPVVSSSLVLIHHGIEGRVGPSSPLEALRDSELLAVCLVQDRGERGSNCVS